MKNKLHPNKAEADLTRRFQGGDVGAFDRIFDMYRTQLFAYAIGMVKDRGAAEDIVQDCFIALARHIHTINPERGLSGWLYRVTRNSCIDSIRRRKHEVPGEEEVLQTIQATDEEGPESADRSLMRREENARLRQKVDKLPRKERELLILRFYSDLTFKEISQVVRRPLGTVLWQVRKTLMRLKDEM